MFPRETALYSVSALGLTHWSYSWQRQSRESPNWNRSETIYDQFYLVLK